MSSLQGLLLGVCALTAVGVELGAGVALLERVEGSLTAELDRSLEVQARILASHVEFEHGRIVLEFVEDLDPRIYADPERGVSLRLWVEEALHYTSPGALGPSLLGERARERAPRWESTPHGRVRVVELGFSARVEFPRAGDDPPRCTLALTRGGAELDAFLGDLRRQLLVVGAGAWLILVGALACAIRIGLRPLRRLSTRIAAVGPQDLSTRLDPREAPRELRAVVEQFNGVLARLELAFAREQGFSRDVAHELRTPLAGARAALEVALAREREAADYRVALAEGLEVLGTLESLVERLFQLTRLEGRVAEGSRQRVSLADLVLEVWERSVHAASQRRLAVTFEVDEDALCWGDRELLLVALRNVFENATAYADAGGAVRIAVRTEPGAEVSLRVENSGSQVATADLEHVTRPFWRGDRARTAAAEHAGLGLSLVARIAEACGGRLRLESEAGGTFVVELLLPTPPAEAPE